MIQKSSYFALAALLLSPPLLAMTDAEIEARFKQYEARINALESDLAKAKKSSPVYVEDLAKSVERVEKQLAQKSEGALKVNGFITAGMTVANKDLNNYGIDETPNFRGLSKAGVQLTYPLNDRADATIQMVARTDDSNSNDAWDVDAEWAYLRYRLTDDLQVRAGRLRTPFYMYSESLDVGYSYPWARPPLDVYRSPLTAYDGVDMLYDFKTGGINNRIQFWTGSYADTTDGPAGVPDDLELKDQYGVNITSTWGDFTARAMVFTIAIDGTTTVDVNGGVPPIYAQFDAEDKLDYSAIGFQWDNGQYFVITETTDLRSRDGLFFTDEKAGYISGGTRIQDWTPYATYGWYHTANEEDYLGTASCAGGLGVDNKTCSGQSKSFGFGVRKELGTNLAMKMQWDRYYDFDDTNGYYGFAGYSSTAIIPPAPPFVNTTQGEEWDEADVLTITLDAVF